MSKTKLFLSLFSFIILISNAPPSISAQSAACMGNVGSEVCHTTTCPGSLVPQQTCLEACLEVSNPCTADFCDALVSVPCLDPTLPPSPTSPFFTPSPTLPAGITPSPTLLPAPGGCILAAWSSGGWICPQEPGLYLCNIGYCCYGSAINSCSTFVVRPTPVPASTPCSTDANCINDYLPGYGFPNFNNCLMHSNGTPYCASTSCGLDSFHTALGCLPYTGISTIQVVLNWAAALSGGIGLILIIVGSVQLIFSRGDMRKSQAAKEIITSAIGGIIFIALCLLITNWIGASLLNLGPIGFLIN